MMFMGLNNEHMPRFPCWLHKDGCEPLYIENETDEKSARGNGYDNITAAAMSNRYLINWFWDLEDMSPRQLCVFAKDEYGVDLPIEAGQDRLFRAVVELTRNAPQNQNRLVLMAHSIKMNYDETLLEIRRMMEKPDPGWETETISFEVEM